MKLTFAPHQFLGVQELRHLRDSLGEDGYIRMVQQIATSYGVVKLPADSGFNSLKVVPGTSNGDLTIQAGVAVDSDINAIELLADDTDALVVPGDSTPRYVIIEYTESTVELGTVSISATGAITGVGTEFTKLRGLPNFPMKITFNGSANTQEYQIESITDDTNMQLNIASGLMTVESDKTYSIVGTFTPGTNPIPANKYPMKRDSYTLTLSASSSVTAGTQFLLASAVNDGATTVITDLRGQNLFSTGTSDVDLQSTNDIATLIQGYYDEYNNVTDPEPIEGDGSENYYRFDWGLISSGGNWSSSGNTIDISTGSGGIISATDDFVDGMCDGWYVYYTLTGERVKIIKSVQTEPIVSQFHIILTLETTPSGPSGSGAIHIVPPGDSIEITASGFGIGDSGGSFQTTMDNVFPMSARSGVIKIPANAQANVRWRAFSHNQSTPLVQFNASTFTDEDGGSVAFNGDYIVTKIQADSRATWGHEWTLVTGLDIDLLNGNTTVGAASIRYKKKGKHVVGTLYGQAAFADFSPATNLFSVDVSSLFSIKALPGFFTAQAGAGWIAENTGPYRYSAVVFELSGAIAITRYDNVNYTPNSSTGVTFTVNFCFEIN